VGPDEFKSAGTGHPSGAKRRKFFREDQYTVWPVCCLQFTVPYGVGATVCGYMLWMAVISHTGGIDTAVWLWTPAHIHQFFASTRAPIFLKLIGFASISRLALAPVGGGAVAPICPPP